LLAAWAAEVLLVELVLDVLACAAVVPEVVELIALVAMVQFFKRQSNTPSVQSQKT
jgi:hypothetical protein